MSIFRPRLKAAHVVAALALATFMTSTAGQAVTPLMVQKAVDEATDEAVFQPQAAIVQEPAEGSFEHVGEGEASFYGNELAGNRTASGERFNPRALTAAHRTLPLGSKLRVTNKANGKSVIVRINDRGPFTKARLIDISFAAAQELNLVRAGKGRVRLDLLR
jgi:rare lipoprotein A